jgi:hypothetical protein
MIKYSRFATYFYSMSENKSKTGYWMLFLVSLVAIVGLLIFLPQAFWLALPTTVGGFAMAMDWI